MPNTYHIWNPTLQSEARAIGGQLKKASDHYPVTLDLNL
jgi:endonuclease/exonuclease/phosphatase family metal-dependent hydrolase